MSQLTLMNVKVRIIIISDINESQYINNVPNK